MTASVVEVIAGTKVASDAATVTSTLSNAIEAGDVVVALIACNAVDTNHTFDGLGATWRRVSKDRSAGLLDVWIGTGATATGTVTATQTTSVSGAFKLLNLWHLRGTTEDFVGTVDNGPSGTLVGGPMSVSAGQIFIGSGYAETTTDAYSSPSPATGWVNSGALELVTGQRFASRVHRIPTATEDHFFSTIRSNSNHPVARIVVGIPDAGGPAVRHVYSVSAVGTANPTVDVTDTPGAGDVLVLLMANNAVNSKATAVDGCGATWSRVAGALSTNEILDVWVGTGANASGTVTATATALGSFGRAMEVLMVSGTTATAVGVTASGSGAITTPTQSAGSGQAVFGLGFSTTAASTVTATAPATGWTELTIDMSSTVFAGTLYRIPDARKNHNFTAQRPSSTTYTSQLLLGDGPPLPTVTVQHREGDAWVERTGLPKARVGGAWVTGVPKRWNGSAWVDLT